MTGDQRIFILLRNINGRSIQRLKALIMYYYSMAHGTLMAVCIIITPVKLNEFPSAIKSILVGAD